MMNIFHNIVAQIPQGVPNPEHGTPLSIETVFDVILWIVLPALIIVGYFLWRKREIKRKQKDENKNG